MGILIMHFVQVPLNILGPKYVEIEVERVENTREFMRERGV